MLTLKLHAIWKFCYINNKCE